MESAKPDTSKMNGGLDALILAKTKTSSPSPAAAPQQMVEKMVKFNLELPESLRLTIKLAAANMRTPMNQAMVDALQKVFCGE